MKVLTNLDLNKNQILNAVLQGLATAPETPARVSITIIRQIRFCIYGTVLRGLRLVSR